MKDLKNDPFGKFNGNEQKYANQALDSSLDQEKSFNLRFEEAFAEKFNCNKLAMLFDINTLSDVTVSL